jgi:hypothetical protein
MAKIVRDDAGNPVPQYLNADGTAYEAAKGAGGAIDVNVKVSELPEGASTEAKQDSIIGYVDQIETLLTAIKDTSGIKKINDPLPTGANVIGKTGLQVAGADVTQANPVPCSITGSLAKLSTEPFPAGVDGNTLIEFYPDNNNKYYKYYLGEWRLI